MCGIGGIIRREPNPDSDPRADMLLRALRHRGPDDSGIYQSLNGYATLVHTRLSILDPTPSGHQPMRKGDLTITFNGEIYNFEELRHLLIHQGEAFQTRTDTEVILTLFQREGVACLRHLRGMFALGVWDERRRTAFLVRDRFGVKPLYYGWSQAGELMFASEVRALLATNSFPRKIDPQGLNSYLVSGSVAEPRTMIEGISCLQAGEILEWHDGKASLDRYYEIKFSTATDGGHPVDSTRAALLDSVSHHLVSDVPVGISLSGGLDSGAVVSLAREFGAASPTTLTVAVENQHLSESVPARARAKGFGTQHQELLLTSELGTAWLPDFFDDLDQPTVDGFNTYCLAKFASAHGLQVLLSGVGGDELFAGYPSFDLVPTLQRAGRTLGPLKRVGASLVRHSGMQKGKAARLAHYLDGPPTLKRAYETVRSVFSPPEARLLTQRICGSDVVLDNTLEAACVDLPGDPREAVSHLELTRYLRNQLLRDTDVMGMAHGVEIRVPFVDHVLFEELQNIPACTRLAPGKRLLRQAVPEVAVVDAKKRGFTLPVGSWLDGPFGSLTKSLTNFGQLVFLDDPGRQWSLLILLYWLKGIVSWNESA